MRGRNAALFAAAGSLFAISGAQAQPVDDAAALAAEVSALRAKLEAVEAKLAALEAAKSTEQPPAPQPKKEETKVAWRGAPQFSTESGWSFKPRGRLQFDAGHVSSPGGISDPGLGFSNEIRRARVGVEGTIPGGFGYRFEVDFADNAVEVADATLSYQASKSLGFVVGQHNNFQSLEELTSSRFLSFMERAAFTDAFNFERRLGISLGYARGDFLANAGVFTDNIDDLSGSGTGLGDENEAMSADARIVYAPKAGDTQLHFGGSAHFRDSGDAGSGALATRYRQRPFVHTTDTRFIGTPSLAVSGETHYGLEAALVRGPLHAAGEVHWLNARILDAPDPTFFGGYAEIGYFLTGETRGYRNGQFDRTKVLRPVGGGGFGAFQINLRYDHLDLNDAGILGGRQQGYAASLVWIPQDYVRFILNYARLGYDNASLIPTIGDRDYSVDVVGARAQVDF